MAKVFLDTNILIDITRSRGDKNLPELLGQHATFLSPLSAHILFYSYKTRVPDVVAHDTIDQLEIVDLTKAILDKSLDGPTPNLEDNIQLHSAVEADCDVFLTSDQKLLSLGYFGKTKITSTLSTPV